MKTVFKCSQKAVRKHVLIPKLHHPKTPKYRWIKRIMGNSKQKNNSHK